LQNDRATVDCTDNIIWQVSQTQIAPWATWGLRR